MPGSSDVERENALTRIIEVYDACRRGVRLDVIAQQLRDAADEIGEVA